MKCTKCQFDNPSGAKFCNACGDRLEIVCSACDKTNPIGSNFCNQCGQDIMESTGTASIDFNQPQTYTPEFLADKILTSRTAMEGERKLVTVLFCDIFHSTSLAEQLGPEAMHSVLDKFFGLALAQVHRYEGTINQFLGDGFMALFGAPIAHEDHARRAVLAALGIQQSLLETEIKAISPLRVRMGLNTGTVVVGAIGDNLRMDYTAVGDTTNLAARLQQKADPGQVLASETTHRMVEGYSHTRPLGQFSFKGKAEPVLVWEVISARTHRTRLEVETERGLTPFMGRKHELRLLLESFEKAKAGQGQMVFIVGDPGIGKSRLLFEFRREVEREADWLEGHSISFGQSMPFHPLIDMLKRNFRIEEGEPEEVIAEKIEAGLPNIGEDLRWSLPYLRYLLVAGSGDPYVQKMNPKVRRVEIFDALRRLTLHRAKACPQVVVFEDLHWMDQSTEAYLRFFSDSVPSNPVLFIFTYRPGYINPFAERTYQTRIALTNLSNVHSVQMAQAMLATHSLPKELQGLIARKAEGNPFFVEEVVKSLQETGAIQQEGNRYPFAEPLNEVFIPDTVQDVITARIDRLQESPKKVLQTAAVIGREFTYRLLDRIAETNGKTEVSLQELKALELIYEKDLFPELAYMFKHTLTQEVAYNSLLVQRRQELHRLIGRVMEDLYVDRLAEQYEVLAYHFAEGGELAKALEYLLKAADKAAGSFANREAIHLYDRALALVACLENPAATNTVMEIHKTKAELYLVLSDFEGSRHEAEKALAIARQGDDRVEQGAAFAAMGYASLWAHDFDRATGYAHKAIEVAEGVGADSVLAGGHFITGDVELLRGRLEQAEVRTEHALRLSRSANEVLYQSFSLSLLGHLRNWRGEYAEALSYLSEGLGIAREHNLLAPLFDNLFMHGITLIGKGDYDQALEQLEEGLSFSEKVGDEVYHLRIMNTLGWLYLECGDLELALDLNQQAALGSRKRGDPEMVANSELNMADIFLAKNDLVLAQEYLAHIHRLTQDPKTSDWMKWRYSMHLYASHGELSLARGNLTKAKEYAERCLEIAKRTNSRKYLVKGWRVEGNIAVALRQWDESETCLEKALSVALAIGNPTQIWKTNLAMGHQYAESKRQEKARQSYQAAREVIDGLKARLQNPRLRASLENSSVLRQVFNLSESTGPDLGIAKKGYSGVQKKGA